MLPERMQKASAKSHMTRCHLVGVCRFFFFVVIYECFRFTICGTHFANSEFQLQFVFEFCHQESSVNEIVHSSTMCSHAAEMNAVNG